MKKNLNDFLKETKYCNFRHPLIHDKASEITKDCNNDQEKAVALFYWVRDNIKYRFGAWNKSASEVLHQKCGMCTNKAVLFTSLLRALGIPAGFGILKVKGQEYFGPIGPTVLMKRVGEISVHIYSYVFLSNKWFKVDTSVDVELSKKTNYFNPTTELTEWHGDNDATENLDPKHILSDSAPLFIIDKKLDRRPRNAKKVLFKIGNSYLDFLRQNNINIINPEKQLPTLFEIWLKKKHFLYYILYLFYFKIRKNDKRKFKR